MNPIRPTKSSVRRAINDPSHLAESFLLAHQPLRFHRGSWYQFDGVRYRELQLNDIRADVVRHIQREFDRVAGRKKAKQVTRSVVADTLQAVESVRLVPSEADPPVWLDHETRNLVAVENGLLDLEGLLTGKPQPLEPHSAKWFSTVALPYAFDSSATAPRWERFLKEILNDDADAIALVQQWFGYCLVPETRMQKFLLLTGEGSNGKSVLLEVLVRMLGEANVSHVPLELFGQRFQLIETLGKLANVATEVGEIDRVAEGLLKAFTSGDRMQFEAKGKQPISARPTARLVFSTNNLPKFADRSNGVWRRMLLVPFGRVFKEDEQNKNLLSELVEELPGILNWAIEGLVRLRVQGRFTEPEASKQAVAEYKLEANPARAFLSENVVAVPDALLPCGQLYGQYRSWCEEYGARPLDASQFGREVKRFFPDVKRKKMGGRGDQKWYYLGIQCTRAEHGFTPGPFAPFVVTPNVAA